MKPKSSYIGVLGVALVLALPATASAQKSRHASCPSQASGQCGKVEKGPALVPERFGPKIKPTQVRGVYGGEAWQSGSWQMS